MAIFTNQATLSYRNGAVSSNVVTGEILEVLSATKNALTDTYSAGDSVTYVISILNSGATAISNVSVSDDLGAYPFGETSLVPLSYVEGSVAYYLDGVLQPDPTVTQGTALTFSNLTIPANGNAILVYEATVNEFASPGADGEIINTATISGAGLCNDVIVTDTITASNTPSLGITKGISPTAVTENGQLTYTFTIQNLGNADATAADQLVVTDTFEPTLSSVTVTYNGALWTEGVEYNYDPQSGVFSTVAGNITVPAATYMQDPVSGEWNLIPGESTLTVTGNVVCST